MKVNPSMTTFIHSYPRARKTHRCTMCGRTIEIGEKYLRGAGLDGTAWSWKECTHCEAARIAYDIPWDVEYNEDTFAEWSTDLVRSIPEARAAAGYQNQWRTQAGTLWPMPGTEESK